MRRAGRKYGTCGIVYTTCIDISVVLGLFRVRSCSNLVSNEKSRCPFTSKECALFTLVMLSFLLPSN